MHPTHSLDQGSEKYENHVIFSCYEENFVYSSYVVIKKKSSFGTSLNERANVIAHLFKTGFNQEYLNI